MTYVTISAKIDRKLHKKYGISVSKVIRKALEEEVRRIGEEPF